MPTAEYDFRGSSVRSVSIRLRNSQSRYIAADELEMSFDLDELRLATGKSMRLSAVKLHLQTFFGVVKCEGSGVGWMTDHLLHCEVRLPQKDIPGKPPYGRPELCASQHRSFSMLV
jgi:hypothetical protein